MSGRGPILIMAGGTGGHVFPALAVAEALRGRGVEVHWLGTRRGLEARVVPAAGFPIEYVSIGGLRGKGWSTWLAAPWRISRALLESLSILRRLRPAAVLGMGGFVTGPGGLASWLLRAPLVIHEQNAIAGLTNRYLARFAARVLEAFPGTFAPAAQARCTGNPVRPAICQLPTPAERFAARTAGPRHVLVQGGSLGALVLNEVVAQAVAALPAAARPSIRHQAGERTLQAAERAYREAGVPAQVTPFIEDMAEAYGWADLVICRAGALTISELAACGVGAILVPYPHAVDDHQTRNAAYLVDNGAAVLLPQGELDAARLAGLLGTLLGDEAALLAMAQAARALARPDATRRVAEHCLEVAHG